MDMFDGVGRRLDETSGRLVNIGQQSLNGRERDVLFRNNRDGSFTDVAFVNGADRIEDGRGLSIFDYDRDGGQDILLRNYLQPAELLRSRGNHGRHWLSLKLVATRSNRDAIGARIRLETSRGRQTREVTAGSGYLSASSLVQHFGLGSDQAAGRIEVRWPSGARTVLQDLEADRRHVIVEGRARTPR